METADLCRKHGISQATFFIWESRFGAMDLSDARRLRMLEEENRKLKKLLARSTLMKAQVFRRTRYLRLRERPPYAFPTCLAFT